MSGVFLGGGILSTTFSFAMKFFDNQIIRDMVIRVSSQVNSAAIHTDNRIFFLAGCHVE